MTWPDGRWPFPVETELLTALSRSPGAGRSAVVWFGHRAAPRGRIRPYRDHQQSAREPITRRAVFLPLPVRPAADVNSLNARAVISRGRFSLHLRPRRITMTPELLTPWRS